MATKAAEPTWKLDTTEQAEVEEQARMFVESNQDVIEPLLLRIAYYKRKGEGDNLLLAASVLGTIVKDIMQTPCVVPLAGRPEMN